MNKSEHPPLPVRTLGPVSDLERHLPQDWWRTLFNAVYLKTDGDVVENDVNTAQEIDLLIRAAGIEPGDRVLDLCCGQGRHSLELARRGFGHVVGIDRSRYLIRLARRRAKQSKLAVSFHEGDARKFRVPEGDFRCVCLMGNSFGYFARAEDDAAVLAAVRRALVSRGTLVLDLADGDWVRSHFERRSWEWIDAQQFVCRERSLSADGSRLVCREVVTHAEKGVIADQFYAERLYSRAEIQALVEEAGFGDVRFHEWVTTDSERNQDLGMMAERFLLTATAPLRAPVARSHRAPLEVAVLLGDPRLPDEVKRDMVFNEEDRDTVERLREALADLSDFRFRYLDNHASMFGELRREPPALAFNLCDTGYGNDAFRELHVPAYLETLGVPYTGAGPQCLALCYDKGLVRALADSMAIPVPMETIVQPDDSAGTIPSIFPALVKPCYGDGSIGITKDAIVHSAEEAVAYLARMRTRLRPRPFLIQEYLPGREYGVSLIGNPGTGFAVLPVMEVDFSGLPKGLPPILGYESKWLPDSPYWSDIRYGEATCDDDTRRTMIDYSMALFERLGCRDYARFDFRTDIEGTVKLLEINPNPGWSWDGKLNYMAGFDGHSYSDLLAMILQTAVARLSLAESATAPEAARVEMVPA
jgi:D-alanine-D-alanine ligase